MINSRNIEDLTTETQLICKKFIEKCKEADITIKIIQTLRDAEYQKSLYNSGRVDKTKKILTNCDGYTKKSAHQSGKAFDAVPVDEHGNILWSDMGKFRKMAEIGKSIGLKAGYYFKMIDSPHFEL